MKRFFSILCAAISFGLSLYAVLAVARESPELSQMHVISKHLWVFVAAIIFILLHVVIERSDDL